MPIYKDKTKTTDGRQYYFVINYTDVTGAHKKYKSKRFFTRREAMEQETLYQLSQGKELPTASITFSVLIEQYIAEKEQILKPMSLRDLKIVCEPILSLLGSVSVSMLTITQFVDFRSQIANKCSVNGKPLSVSYKNKILKQLRALCQYAELRYNIVQNTPKKYPYFTDYTPKEMDFYTYDDFQQFISCADGIWKPFFTTLYFIGCRLGEANALLWQDVDFENNTIRINKTETTKIKGLVTTPKTSKSKRILPMPKIVADALKTLDRANNEHLFGKERAIPETTIQKAKKDICKQAGIREIRLHDFRHSFVSFAIHMGANISVISKYVGHASISETMRTYSHLFASDLDDFVAKIDNFVPNSYLKK